MKRTLIALFAVMSLAAVALASSLPQSGTVVVSNDSGAQVGTGVISGGKLTLTLDPGTTGLVTITVTSSSGETESYQAMIDSSGTVTVIHDGSFEKLDDYAKASGIDKVEVGESTDKTSSSSDSSSSSEDASCPDSGVSASGSTGSTGPATMGTSGTASCGDTSADDSTSESADDSKSSSGSATTSHETESSSDDSIKVGTSVGTGSDSSSTGGTVDVKGSEDD